MKYKIELRVETATVVGASSAAEMAARLARQSVWFVCTPLPEDTYEFAVKEDSHQALLRAVTA